MSSPEPGRAVSRRAVVVAAGAVAAGACGRPGAGPDAEPTVPATPTRHPPRPVAPVSDIPVGGGRVYPDVPVVVTQPSPGEFRGFGIVCTHDGCQLNSVADGTINCPCHGSRYAITDGSVVRGPARTGLRIEHVAVEGEHIVLIP